MNGYASETLPARLKFWLWCRWFHAPCGPRRDGSETHCTRCYFCDEDCAIEGQIANAWPGDDEEAR